MLQAGSGKTSILEGRSSTEIDDSSNSTPSQEGLVQLISKSLFELLQEKQVVTGGLHCSSSLLKCTKGRSGPEHCLMLCSQIEL